MVCPAGAIKPLAGELVRVEEILDPAAAGPRAPFACVGVTNSDGRFQAATPAGKLKVTATGPSVVQPRPPAGVSILPALPHPGATAEATVEQGKFREVTLRIDSGIR